MIDGAKVINNKMKLDSILKSRQIKSVDDSVKIADLVLKLNQADENMMDWMHAFNDDFKGRDETENLNYYKSEMVKIRNVEDSYIKVTRASDSVLKIYNVAPSQIMEMKNHKH